MAEISLWQILIAFFGGIISILSPCIISILPGFLAYLAGLNFQEAHQKKNQKKIILASLSFCLGYILIFSSFGLFTSGISLFLFTNQILLQKIAGIILIIFGIIQTGFLKWAPIQREFKVNLYNIKSSKNTYFTAFIIGILFAFSWTPCYGPIIGSIFTLSATSETFLSGIILFFFYSLGFTIPILLIALGLNKISKFLIQHKKLFAYLNIFIGILFIIMGLLIFTNNISNIVNWFSMVYTKFKLNL